ncbi:MAG: hypothetical protein ACOCPR_07025, partial [Guyparkeria sp.]
MTKLVQGDITKPRSAATSRGDRMIVARDRMLSESLTGCVGLRTLRLTVSSPTRGPAYPMSGRGGPVALAGPDQRP